MSPSTREVMARRDAGAQAVLAALLALAATVATAGFHAIFDSWSFVVAAAVGALVAGIVSVGGAWRRLLVGEEIALAVVGFVLAGIAVAGGPAAFLHGLTRGWATVVSVTQPADLTAELRVVPFALAWLGALIGCELARHVRQPAVPIAGPLVTTVLTVLLSAEEHAVALAQGAVVAALGLAVGVVQQRRLRRAATAARRRPPRTTGRSVVRLLPATTMVLAITAAAPLLGPHLPLAGANERYDLRQHVTPPWDPLALPSPLVEVKASLVDERRDTVVFHVDATTKLPRWQTAVMGNYDGVVWTVGTGSGSTAGEFEPVGSRLPAPAASDVGDQPTVTATVTVLDLDGPWVPTPGWPRALQPLTPVPGDVRANLRTGTVALTDGLPDNLSYNVTAAADPAADDGALSSAHITALPPSAQLDALPPAIRNLSADIVQGKPFGWPQVMAIRDTLRNDGFYDASPGVAPGHSFYRLAELLADQRRMVGFEEQYAAAAAVMMRVAQIPARVAVGYLIPDEAWSNGGADVHAGDISAWVEVHVDGVGWVPVDVTPPRNRTPTVEQQGTATRDVAVPDPPPPPPPPPDIQVITAPQDDEDDPTKPVTINADGIVDGGGWTAVQWTAAGGSSLVLLAALAAGGIVGTKWWRRRKRRQHPEPAVRIAGAWNELADRCVDAGVPLPPQTTPLEAARAYLDTEPSGDEVRGELYALVGTIDRAAYHAEPPDDRAAEQAWANCDDVVAAMVRRRHLRQRVRMRLSPRTAFHRDRLRSKQ